MIRMALIVAACCTFGGCAQFDAAVTSAATTINRPEVQQALSTVKDGVHSVACGLSAAAAGASGVETIQYKGAPIVDDKGRLITAVVYAASSVLCPSGAVVVAAS